MKSLLGEGSFSEAQVAEAMRQTDGDVEAAVDKLTSQMLSDLHDNIHIELSKVTAPPAMASSSDIYYIDAETEVVMKEEADLQVNALSLYYICNYAPLPSEVGHTFSPSI